MFSTLMTYPLDSIRLRLAVDPNVNGMGAAVRVLVKEGGVAALYRGVGTSMIGDQHDFIPDPSNAFLVQDW